MKEIALLEHVACPLPGGGEVLVINTGALIGPEAEAMLQALYSRSIGGVREQLKKLAAKGPESFMRDYYVGYGHKSIGDCGTATVCIDGVSMLVAKAIQDTQLYSGQESSTRYIDFSTQPFIDPVGTIRSRAILEEFRAFYLKNRQAVESYLEILYPQQENENEILYKKAISARAFDILRGFLPAGASTNLSWHTNLRQFADRLALLRHHPLREVRDVANITEEALQAAFASSFSQKCYSETESYNEFWMTEFYLLSKETPYEEVCLLRNRIGWAELKKYERILSKRPQKTELPKFLAELGTMQFGFMLDFGSFRDIQRQRSVIERMPLVTNVHGFGSWYFESLPSDVRKEAEELLSRQKEAIRTIDMTEVERQYYIPMGYELPNRLTGDLPALVYVVELRATRFVHPTLSEVAGKMAEILLEEFGSAGLVLHLDQEPGRFDIRRGKHDIVERSL